MATGPGISRAQYAEAMLNQLGYPTTPSNIDFLVAWMNREGTAAAYNPLATTQQADGSYALSGNSAGVQQYTSAESGIDATVKTLTNGMYGDILTALAGGNAMAQASSGALARGLSTWSGGGYTSVGASDTGSRPVPASSQAASASSGGFGVATPDSAPDQQDAGGTLTGDFANFFRSQAPQLAESITDPVARQIITDYGNDKISDQQFESRIMATDWYRNTPDTQRQQLVNQATDPATAQQTLDNLASVIRTTAAKYGVAMSPNDVNLLALTAINNNWSTDHVNQHIASFAKYSGPNTVYKGDAGTAVQQIQKAYADYALPVSNATVNSLLPNILDGTATIGSINQRLATQAKSLYGNNPDLAAALDRGETVAQFMQPYADYANQILGPQTGDINWLDPKWNTALTGTVDASGRTTPMSLAQWGKTLRSNPIYGYDTSPDAVKTASQFAVQLTQAMTGASV